jgi:hypothetical protein
VNERTPDDVLPTRPPHASQNDYNLIGDTIV